MKKIAIVHYQPLEYYPPITNLLNAFSKKENLKIQVWTTRNNKKRKTYRQEKIAGIHRTALPAKGDLSIIRFFKYVHFGIRCFFGLISFNPDKILYFESYSVLPIYFYLRFINHRVPLFIHYHEYFSPDWYKSGMTMLKTYYKWEKNFLYKRAVWISQTNKDRVRLFLNDNPKIDASKLRILPNYPPKNWQQNNVEQSSTPSLRSIYIGSLTLEHSYLKEYCDWVKAQDGKVLFDIYGYNYNSETLTYLREIDSPYIIFFEGGIDYYEIPETLQNYDVGLILYTAQDDNFKYNASNKLFEYLACGLQVWYSAKMLGVDPYKSENVIAVEFENLDAFNYITFFENRRKLDSARYTAEEALQPLSIELAK